MHRYPDLGRRLEGREQEPHELFVQEFMLLGTAGGGGGGARRGGNKEQKGFLKKILCCRFLFERIVMNQFKVPKILV